MRRRAATHGDARVGARPRRVGRATGFLVPLAQQAATQNDEQQHEKQRAHHRHYEHEHGAATGLLDRLWADAKLLHRGGEAESHGGKLRVDGRLQGGCIGQHACREPSGRQRGTDGGALR